MMWKVALPIALSLDLAPSIRRVTRETLVERTVAHPSWTCETTKNRGVDFELNAIVFPVHVGSNAGEW